MTARVVIIGGGYVGVWAARRIARASGSLGDVEITLVSASPVHSFHGWTAEVITGHVRPERARVPLERLVPGVAIVAGRATRIDAKDRRVDVATDAGIRSLPYDHLVLGVGSRDAVERVPGLGEHGWSLKDTAGVAALRAHLSEIVERAATAVDGVQRARLLTVVVAGGGFTGMEASAAIAQRLRAAVGSQPGLANARPRVILVHASREPLPSLRPRFRRVADYAAAQAVRAGVELCGGTRLARVTDAGAELSDGRLLPSETVVTTIGQIPVALPGTELFAHDATGRISADRFLRVAPGVWAGGDVAAVPHPTVPGACPDNALWAIYHGKRIGSNVVRVLRGRRPVPFRFPGLGQGASFGVGRGAAELYGISLTGWPAWIARWGFFHWFMPSRSVALRTAAEWMRRPAAADQVGRSIPVPSTALHAQDATTAPLPLVAVG